MRIAKQKRHVFVLRDAGVEGPLQVPPDFPPGLRLENVHGDSESLKSKFLAENLTYCGRVTRFVHQLVWELDRKYLLFFSHFKADPRLLSVVQLGTTILIHNAIPLGPTSSRKAMTSPSNVHGFVLYIRSSVIPLSLTSEDANRREESEREERSRVATFEGELGVNSYLNSPLRHHYDRISPLQAHWLNESIETLVEMTTRRDDFPTLDLRLESIIGFHQESDTGDQTGRSRGVVGRLLNGLGFPASRHRSYISEFLLNKDYLEEMYGEKKDKERRKRWTGGDLRPGFDATSARSKREKTRRIIHVRELLEAIVGYCQRNHSNGSHSSRPNNGGAGDGRDGHGGHRDSNWRPLMAITKDSLNLSDVAVIGVALYDIHSQRLLFNDILDTTRSQSGIEIQINGVDLSYVFGSLLLVDDFVVFSKDEFLVLASDGFVDDSILQSFIGSNIIRRASGYHRGRFSFNIITLYICPIVGDGAMRSLSHSNPKIALGMLIQDLRGAKKYERGYLGFYTANEKHMQLYAALEEIGLRNMECARTDRFDEVRIYRLQMANASETQQLEDDSLFTVSEEFWLKPLDPLGPDSLSPSQFRGYLGEAKIGNGDEHEVLEGASDRLTFVGIVVGDFASHDFHRLNVLGKFLTYSATTRISRDGEWDGLGQIYVPARHSHSILSKLSCIANLHRRIVLKNLVYERDGFAVDGFTRIDAEIVPSDVWNFSELLFCLSLQLMRAVDIFKGHPLLPISFPVICSLESVSYAAIEVDRIRPSDINCVVYGKCDDGTAELFFKAYRETAWTLIDHTRKYRGELMSSVSRSGNKIDYVRQENQLSRDCLLQHCIEETLASRPRFVLLCKRELGRKRNRGAAYVPYDNGITISRVKLNPVVLATSVYILPAKIYAEHLIRGNWR